jgi:kinetochore protein NDC80
VSLCSLGILKVGTDKSSVRRSSIFPGRPSIAPGSALGAVPKETRPVRNLQFQQACQQNIHQYLQDSRYGYPMHSKTFTSPTQKDFQNMFNHLVQMLLPGGFPGGKSFEADCYALLKDLKYPAADSCGKTALGAPGTPQNWPHMLAMLNWLVDLCKVSGKVV